ncbi:MAG TPA: prolyl oligopeptidase family serine peptidase, partial [Arenicellales bacterium]|nr:prolyl oligopeptidase family serine peptidase [Arenicellales bacterium]
MSADRTTAPYGFWTGLFDVGALFEKPPTPMYPLAHGGLLYWLETRAEEGGRVVLMQRDASGNERCLTAAGFSLRSRVHEYGGCPYTLHGGACYFVNDSDQRIYRQSLDGDATAVAVTPEDDGGAARRYIDLAVTPEGDYLMCVMECEQPAGENLNVLAALRLEPGVVHQPAVIRSGCDFYANVVLDPGRGRIAWFEWDHPCMPWDESRAVVASCTRGTDGLRLADVETVAGGANTSVCQLAFDDDGDLLLAIDGESAPGEPRDYWNLYRRGRDGFTQLTFDEMEYGAPHWVFGDRRYAVLSDCLLAVRSGPGGDELVAVDKRGEGAERIECDAVDIRQLSHAGADEALMIAASADRSPALTMWKHGRLTPIKGVHELLPAEAVSRPRAISYVTGGGETAHAWFYPPCNPHFRAPQGEAPPLLVMVHGGPTSRCSGALDLTRQYWTGIGFAVLDVNYRGSTGYGRTYRQSLLGNWGLSDTEDVARGIEHAAKQGWINPGRVFIRGRSAGGYAVLCALTRYPDVFAAGACYYGIGNLGTLAQITHKFEGRYTDRLIGEPYRPGAADDPDSRFHSRSPIHGVSRI